MRNNSQAFARVELLAILFVLSLLGACALPLLATTRGDSDRAGCFNNLRQISRAVLLWGGEHDERVSWRTPVSDGGTMESPKAGSAWREWATFTNELRSPSVLACPADTGVRVATTFDNSQTGFFNTGFRANALSYIVGLHAVFDYPQTLVTADRNLRSDVYPTSYSAGVNNADGITTPFYTAGW